jgi:xanthine/CO dehydrogenase XdhC/CoxF family maturation factor
MAELTTDVLTQVRRWREAGKGVALATVVGTWGSSPCQAGSHLAVSDDSAFVGSVSGGCIERLRELGLAELVPRIHAPVGLDLGGRAAAEIAVSVLAQVIQERYRRAP